MPSPQLDLWQDEVAALPWGGTSPRSLAQELVTIRLLKYRRRASCVVDNSVVRCPSREAQCFGTDPAQLMLCIGTSF